MEKSFGKLAESEQMANGTFIQWVHEELIWPLEFILIYGWILQSQGAYCLCSFNLRWYSTIMFAMRAFSGRDIYRCKVANVVDFGESDFSLLFMAYVTARSKVCVVPLLLHRSSLQTTESAFALRLYREVSRTTVVSTAVTGPTKNPFRFRSDACIPPSRKRKRIGHC